MQAVVAGKPLWRAAMEATGLTNPGSAAVQANRMLKNANIQEAIAGSLAKHGITMDAAVAPIADALEANRTTYDKDGRLVDSAPDHSVRLKASGMALDLMGARKQQDGGNNVHFHLYAGEQRDKYGV